MLPLVLLACTASNEPAPSVTRPFPEGFAWGTATAGFQVEMGCPTWSADACEDRASDWYQWVTDPRIVQDEALYVTGEPVSHGPGMWETFEDDVARMAADGHNAFRLSLEWSRLFPDDVSDATTVDELVARADAAAVARYGAMLDALRAAGVEPVVTVNHYVLPVWVHDGVACHLDLDTCPARGWVDGARMVPLIGLYAGFLGRTFGDRVDRWATLNEPFATTVSGYLQPGEDRSSPPGRAFDGPSTVATIRHQIEGSAAMYDALHAEDLVDADGDDDPATVGIVMNMVDMAPYDATREADAGAVTHADYLYHRLFLDALTSGAWDDDLDGVSDRTRADLAGRLDWLGINYYNALQAQHLGLRPLGDLVPVFDFFPHFSWEPHPEGLGAVVRRASAWGLPIWITENGTPHVDRAVEVLDGHLDSLWQAMDEGADVRGYLVWSYVDNYEWNHGFDLKFGLYGLDPVTKARTRRPVADRFAAIIAQGGLE